jgi:hypothetical protein
MFFLTFSSVAAAPPSGKYSGSKSILGSPIDVEMLIDSPATLDVNITMDSRVPCTGEKYTYDGGSTITLLGLNTPGDCIHDALAGMSGLTFQSVTYDSAADTIMVTANYSFLPVSISLSKPPPVDLASRAREAESAEERERWFTAFLSKFGRAYDGAERERRRTIFEANLDRITRRNLDGELGHHFVNKYADMNPEEFRASHLGYTPKASSEEELPLAESATAASIDWRTHSPAVLTPVKDQGPPPPHTNTHTCE